VVDAIDIRLQWDLWYSNFGHFEFANFPMHKGVDNLHGMATDMFQKYELVCSGHYHTRSQRDNIVYLGTPYEINWQDYGDDKGYLTSDEASYWVKLKIFRPSENDRIPTES